MTKTISVKDFLTDRQIGKALHIYEKAADQAEAKRRIQAEIIEPNMLAINSCLGQENDADYLAYLVVYVCQEANREANRL